MKKKTALILTTLLAVFLYSQSVIAATCAVYNSFVKNNSLYIYTQNPGNILSVKCQIGKEYSTDVIAQGITDTEIPIQTFILWDNSLSVKEVYRNQIKELIKGFSASRIKNESITLATFDTEIHYLAQNSQDNEQLIQCIDSVAYQNLDTKLTDVMYSLYQDLESQDFNGFRRIILFSDGMDYNAIGYTYEELMEKISEQSYPVYMFGCIYKSNESELENMFRISRSTHAEYFLLDNVEDINEAIASVNKSHAVVQLKVSIPEGEGDGSQKGVQIVYQTEDGEVSISLTQTMPFISTKAETAMPENKEQISTEKNTDSLTIGTLKLPLYLLIPGACIIVLVFIFLVFTATKKKKANGIQQPVQNVFDDEHTQILMDTDERTTLLNNDDEEIELEVPLNVRLSLIDNPAYVTEMTLKDSLIVGRVPGKCQIAYDFERSVSAQHCRLYQTDGQVYIEDLDSSNGTCVNGTKIIEATKLLSGATLKFGKLLVKFEIV